MFTSQTRLTLLSYRHTVGAAERQTRRQLEPILTEAGPENKRDTWGERLAPLLSSPLLCSAGRQTSGGPGSYWKGQPC